MRADVQLPAFSFRNGADGFNAGDEFKAFLAANCTVATKVLVDLAWLGDPRAEPIPGDSVDSESLWCRQAGGWATYYLLPAPPPGADVVRVLCCAMIPRGTIQPLIDEARKRRLFVESLFGRKP